MSNFNLVMRSVFLMLIIGILFYEDTNFSNGSELEAIYDLSKLVFALSGWTWIDIKISKD